MYFQVLPKNKKINIIPKINYFKATDHDNADLRITWLYRTMHFIFEKRG